MARTREVPILLDSLMNRPRQTKFGPPNAKFLAAHKFVLDSTASEFVGDLLRRAPLEVLQEHEFARTPYDLMWVELDHKAYYKGLRQWAGDPRETDDLIGFLYDNGTVWSLADSEGYGGVPIIMPFKFHLHQPVSFEQELALAQKVGLSRLTFRSALLGSINSDDKWWATREAADICRSHRTELIEEDFTAGLSAEQWEALLRGGAGSLKLILTLALLMSRPGQHVLSQAEVGHRKVIYKGKNAVFKAHHRISLRLEHKDPVTYFTRHLSTGLHRRRHGVRGHWAQTRRLVTRGCDHQWDGIAPDKYECLTCGAKRWWRKAHMRGDSTIGFITKEYDVTR